MIDTTKTRPLFGPPRPLFDTKKRGQLFWAIFWLPKVKKAGPFFLQIGRSLFAQVPIFGPEEEMRLNSAARPASGEGCSLKVPRRAKELALIVLSVSHGGVRTALHAWWPCGHRKWRRAGRFGAGRKVGKFSRYKFSYSCN